MIIICTFRNFVFTKFEYEGLLWLLLYLSQHNVCVVLLVLCQNWQPHLSVSLCDLWIVSATAGRKGNCFLITCAVLFLPVANCRIIGLIDVQSGLIPCVYRFLLLWRVFSPTSALSNCTHIIPDGFSDWSF